MKTKAASRKTGLISVVRAKAILDDALPNTNRGQDFRAKTRCSDPDLIAFQDSHPLAILSGMTCDHFAWQPSDLPPGWRAHIEALGRAAWIGGCYRSPRWRDRTPRALLGSTLRDVWSVKREEVYAALGSPSTCQSDGCSEPITIACDIDHVAPQHAEMVEELISALGGPEAEADWWGYRWRHGENNRLRAHLANHPARPLEIFAEMIDCGTYQALCKPCHRAATKARKVAP
jgi:hypothetical protein